MGGEGERDRIGMREGGAGGRSITVIDKPDLRISLPGGCYITTVRHKQTHIYAHDVHRNMQTHKHMQRCAHERTTIIHPSGNVSDIDIDADLKLEKLGNSGS